MFQEIGQIIETESVKLEVVSIGNDIFTASIVEDYNEDGSPVVYSIDGTFLTVNAASVEEALSDLNTLIADLYR